MKPLRMVYILLSVVCRTILAMTEMHMVTRVFGRIAAWKVSRAPKANVQDQIPETMVG